MPLTHQLCVGATAAVVLADIVTGRVTAVQCDILRERDHIDNFYYSIVILVYY